MCQITSHQPPVLAYLYLARAIMQLTTVGTKNRCRVEHLVVLKPSLTEGKYVSLLPGSCVIIMFQYIIQEHNYEFVCIFRFLFFPEYIFRYYKSVLRIIHSSYFISGFSARNICLHILVMPFNFILSRHHLHFLNMRHFFMAMPLNILIPYVILPN